jgi:hypothetical protein
MKLSKKVMQAVVKLSCEKAILDGFGKECFQREAIKAGNRRCLQMLQESERVLVRNLLKGDR